MVDRDISNGPGTGSGTVDAGLVEFLRTLNDGVTVIGSDRRLKFFNQSYLDLFMLGDGEISLGDESEDVLRALARRGMLGDLGGQSAEDVAAERAAKLGTDESRVERRSTLDGRIIDIYRSPTRQGDIVSIHVDVTETVRNAEEIERQRLYMVSLLENTTDGIALLDRDGRFVMFNNRFLELYDIDPDQVFWGIDYHQFMQHFGDLKGLAEDDREAKLESRYHFAFDPYATQIRRRLRNGRTLNINKTVLPRGRMRDDLSGHHR